MSPSAIARRTAGGGWQAILPKVYRLGPGRPSWETKALATTLWAGDGAAVSHETAAALWSLGAFRREGFAVTTARSLKSPSREIRVRRALLLPPDRTTLEGIPVTTPCRTLLDLAASHPVEAVEAALDEALCRGLTSLPRLGWFVTAHGSKGPAGTKALKRLLARRGPVAPLESELERRVWRLLTAADLPQPVRQHRVYDRNEVVARIDLAYPEAQVAIEVDGYRWHSGRRAWARDLARRNRLTALGWRVVHVTHDDVTRRPHEIVSQVARLLSCPLEPEIRAGRRNFGSKG